MLLFALAYLIDDHGQCHPLTDHIDHVWCEIELSLPRRKTWANLKRAAEEFAATAPAFLPYEISYLTQNGHLE